MTAPFAPPQSRTAAAFYLMFAVLALLLPFGRRDDWRGWMTFLRVCLLGIGLWCWLAWKSWSALLQWKHSLSATEEENSLL